MLSRIQKGFFLSISVEKRKHAKNCDYFHSNEKKFRQDYNDVFLNPEKEL